MNQRPALLRTKAKVFVTQEQSFDFSRAEQFGEIEFLTRDDLHNTKGSLHNEAVAAAIRHKLKKFDPEWDWLLPAGSPYITALVFLLVGSLGHRRLQVLRWSNQDRCYIPLHLDLNNTY